MSRELDEALVEKIKKMEVRIARLEDMVKVIYIMYKEIIDCIEK